MGLRDTGTLGTLCMYVEDSGKVWLVFALPEKGFQTHFRSVLVSR